MQSSTTTPRLLLVDSDPKTLRVLDVSLKKAGFEVLTATNGLEALAALEAAPDLVISDTHMPEMDGFELCRRIKQRPEWAKLPFIFLSSRKSVEERVRGFELGVDDYLTRPIYIREIVTRVRMLLQRAQRERLESRRDPRTRYSGQLADIPVIDLIQTLELNRRAGIIHVTGRDGRRGEIYFRDGQVIDAEAGRQSAAEAVYRLFSWSEGTFEVEFKPIRRRVMIELSAHALLMEGMRRLEEWARLLEGMPALDTVFEVDYQLLTARLAELPDEVNGIFRLFDGRRALYQVIEDCDLPDLEALTVIRKLYTDRLIRETADDGRMAADAAAPVRLDRWLGDAPARPAPGSVRYPAERRPDFDAPPLEGTRGRPTPRAPLQESRPESRPEPAPVPSPVLDRIVRGDVIPFRAAGAEVPAAVPPAPDTGRTAAAAQPETPTTLRSAGPAERGESVVPGTAGTTSNGARDADAQASGSRAIPRSASSPTPYAGSPASASEGRSPFDGSEDTLVVALAAARRQRSFFFMGLGFLAVLIVAAVVLLRPGRAPRRIAAPETPAAPAVAAAPVPAPTPPAPPPVASPSPSSALPPVVAAETSPPAPPAASPPVTPAPAALPPEKGAAAADTAALKAGCVKAYGNGRGKYKTIVSACLRALEADPRAADVMVMLANAELDRGKTKESLEWAQKALAVDASLPEPYVVVGTAEQMAGHLKEAKAAYEQYLELAPTGPFASDLRQVLKGL
jgi:DNA-binding response OmpR family regulator